MKTFTFVFGGQLVMNSLDDGEIELEIGPSHYRALFEDDGKYVKDISFQINDARAGKPPLWVQTTVGLPSEAKLKIIDQIERELAEEQRRMADSWRATA